MTNRQKQFCVEYVKDFNGARAVRDSGYSKNNANQKASILLADPLIQEEIERLNNEINKAPCIASAEEIRSFYSDTMRDVNEKMENRIKAADSLAKTYALFTDKVQMSGTMGVTIIDDIPKEDE